MRSFLVNLWLLTAAVTTGLLCWVLFEMYAGRVEINCNHFLNLVCRFERIDNPR